MMGSQGTGIRGSIIRTGLASLLCLVCGSTGAQTLAGTLRAPSIAPWCSEPFAVEIRPLHVDEAADRPLAALGGNRGGALQVQGVTLGEVYANSRAEGSSLRTAAGCQVYQLSLGYDDVVLAVGSELRDHPCAWAHVHAHENHHLALYREWLDGLAPRVLAALHRTFAGGRFSGSDAQRHAAVQLGLAELRGVMPLQEAFDSAEEYQRNARACEGEIAELGLAVLARSTKEKADP